MLYIQYNFQQGYIIHIYLVIFTIIYHSIECDPYFQI